MVNIHKYQLIGIERCELRSQRQHPSQSQQAHHANNPPVIPAANALPNATDQVEWARSQIGTAKSTLRAPANAGKVFHTRAHPALLPYQDSLRASNPVTAQTS
jgi:hypothetical protein